MVAINSSQVASSYTKLLPDVDITEKWVRKMVQFNKVPALRQRSPEAGTGRTNAFLHCYYSDGASTSGDSWGKIFQELTDHQELLDCLWTQYQCWLKYYIMYWQGKCVNKDHGIGLTFSDTKINCLNLTFSLVSLRTPWCAVFMTDMTEDGHEAHVSMEGQLELTCNALGYHWGT